MCTVPSLPVVIIGAGIAGLSTAKCLDKLGHQVIVLEKASLERQQGYAITLRSWAYEPLAALLNEDLNHFISSIVTDRAIGGRGFIDTSIRRIETNEVLLDLRTQNEGEPVRANRTALRDYLSLGLCVRYSTAVTGLRTVYEDKVELQLESGELLYASFVIAADGMFSSMRQQLLPNLEAELVPSTNYQGQLLVPQADFHTHLRPHLNGSNTALAVTDNVLIGVQVVDYKNTQVQMSWNYIGKGSSPHSSAEHVRDTPVTAAEVLNFISTLSTAQPYTYFFTADRLEKSSTDLFHWNMHAVNTDLASLMKIAKQRRVCFVGDAAHGMPIFAGEGGKHAILDAVKLAKACIGPQADLPVGVSAFLPTAHERWVDAVQRSTDSLANLCKSVTEWEALAAKLKDL